MSKQYDLFGEVKPVQNESFDYGKGDFVNTDVFIPKKQFKKDAEPELKIVKHNKLFGYIISCIDSVGYDIETETDYEKVMFLDDTFNSEYWNGHKNYFKNDEKKGFSEWIPGLPSSFNIDYENHRILEIAVGLDLITESRTEEQEEEFINNWYNLIADNFLKLREEMKKEAPMSNEAIEVIKNSKIEGMVVKLPPDQLDRKVYNDVKQRLELIGGKWKGNKVMGFVFNEDPTELLAQIANGEKRNLKKEFQFFGTPDGLSDRVVSFADISEDDDICEPHAGQGSIVRAINRVLPNKRVYGFEIMSLNQTFLKKTPNFELIGDDFLKCDQKFDKIIANPPFSKNQDIDHIMKMWDCLNFGGRIVTIASKHWQLSNNKKEREFRDFLELYNAKIIEVDAGEFKESGTSIATVILVIDRLF